MSKHLIKIAQGKYLNPDHVLGVVAQKSMGFHGFVKSPDGEEISDEQRVKAHVVITPSVPAANVIGIATTDDLVDDFADEVCLAIEEKRDVDYTKFEYEFVAPTGGEEITPEDEEAAAENIVKLNEEAEAKAKAAKEDAAGEALDADDGTEPAPAE